MMRFFCIYNYDNPILILHVCKAARVVLILIEPILASAQFLISGPPRLFQSLQYSPNLQSYVVDLK